MANDRLTEFHTGVCCPHPYFGFVCTPNSLLDFSETVPPEFGHGAVAGIDTLGFRNSVRHDLKPENELWIGLFGGSVAFSAPATDNDHTLSAYLEESLNQRDCIDAIAPKTRIRVINFALPAGQQPQQMLIYLFNRKALDGIITFDGINEVVIPAHYNAGIVPPEFPYRPFYEALYARKITEEQAALSWLLAEEKEAFHKASLFRRAVSGFLHERRVRELTQRLKQSVPDSRPFVSLYRSSDQDDSVSIERGAMNWRENILIMDNLRRAEGAEALFLLQPVPERHKRLTELEETFLAKHPKILEIRSRGYKLLNEHLAELRSKGVDCVDFAEVFSKESQTVYTDLIHFEDRGCRIVAREIAAHLRQRWSKLGGKKLDYQSG